MVQLNVDDKSGKYNLYYIISESIEKEKISSGLYYDMLAFVMQKTDENQGGVKTDNNE